MQATPRAVDTHGVVHLDSRSGIMYAWPMCRTPDLGMLLPTSRTCRWATCIQCVGAEAKWTHNYACGCNAPGSDRCLWPR